MVKSLQDYKAQYLPKFKRELFESVLPFWEKYSLDKEFGGYFNCIDQDGGIYDQSKYVWLQGREAWLFSKLFNSHEKNSKYLEFSKLGIDFLKKHTIQPNGRVYFHVTREGQPIYLQRKPFSECFYVMALAQYAKASGNSAFWNEANSEFEKVWEFAFQPELLGRPVLPGTPQLKNLAVPMILLNVIEELVDSHSDPKVAGQFEDKIQFCIQEMLDHVKKNYVLENVGLRGEENFSTPNGRLLNPGHAIEAGWFLLHWAIRRTDVKLQEIAQKMIRMSFDQGWDKEFGGIFYFLDAKGYSPTQLEWDMKLWWPHCEALYALLLVSLLSQNTENHAQDLERLYQVTQYTLEHFPDPKYGEWFGYLNRRGEVTHRFKGSPYKCAFHVPRALLYCIELLQK